MARKKILVVDDDRDFLTTIENRLESNDYKVILASNGIAALEKLKKDKPDAVLLDILMPHMDGLEVLKKIREEHKDLPVFIVSAYFSEERFKLANKLKASGFIIKTGDLEKEIININNVLRVAHRYKQR